MIRWNPSHNFQNRRCLSRVRDNPHWCHQWRVRDSCSVVASAGTKLPIQPIPTAYNSTSKYNKHLHNISTPEVQQTLENFAKCNPNPSTPFIRVHWNTDMSKITKPFSCQPSESPTSWSAPGHFWLLFMKLSSGTSSTTVAVIQKHGFWFTCKTTTKESSAVLSWKIPNLLSVELAQQCDLLVTIQASCRQCAGNMTNLPRGRFVVQMKPCGDFSPAKGQQPWASHFTN